MIKYGDTISSQTTGQPIYGAQVTVLNLQGLQATIYSDEAGTIPLSQPILTDQSGYFSFYIDDGRYNVVVMAGQAEIARTNITMVDTLGIKQRALLVPVNEDGGTIAPADARKGMVLAFDAVTGAPSAVLPNEFAGPTGPANSTYTTRRKLEQAPVTNRSYNFAPDSDDTSGWVAGAYFFTPGDFSGAQYAADFVSGLKVKLDAVPLSTGALVRQGAQSITTRLPLPGALDWSQDDVNALTVSVLGFIPKSEHEGIRTGTLAYDCTEAFNKATSAAATHTGNDSPLKRLIKVPAGKYRIDGKVYVRRGQQMIGDGHTSGWIDYTQSGGNGGIVLGCGDTGIGDPGGLGVRLSGLFFYGAGNPAVDATRPDSWVIDNCMFTECGVGIRAGGTDGRIANTIIDGGDVGIELRQGHTIKVADLTFFNTNSDIRIFSNVADVLISNCQSQFAERVCIEFVAGQSNIRGILIEGCQFLLNAQYGTNLGFIFRSSSDLDYQVVGCTFRNGRGLAIGYGGGVNVRQQILDCVFDGAKSFAVYDQSTTAGGVDISNADTTISGCSFTRLAGPSIYFNPTIGSLARIKGSTFSANTGESQEIRIDGGTAASSITIDASTSSDRAIIPAQTSVNIFAMTAARGTATLAAGTVTVAQPLVKASTYIALQRRTDFGTVGASYSVTRNPGVGFTITAKDGAGATQTADASQIDWTLDLAGL